MMYRTEKIHVGDTQMNVASCGQGEPVILVHGLTNNWEGHIPLADELGKHYQVIIPDMPGYGDSEALQKYDIPTMAQYLHELIVALKLDSVIIAGLSMGGFIVGHAAKTYPSRVAKAVIMGPVLSDVHKKMSVMKYIMQCADIAPFGRRVLKRIVDTKLHAYMSAKYLNMYAFDKARIDAYGLRGKHKMSRDAYVDMGLSVAGYDLETTLSELKVPTLLVYGAYDRMSNPDFARVQLLPKNPLLSLQVIEDAGHVVSFEKPEETSKVIISFLEKLDTGH